MAAQPGYVTLPIVSVLAAIGYVYYTTVFLAIPAWLGLATAAGVANAAAYTVLAVACVATYAVAITRDPGRVPPAFVPDVEDAETPIHEIKRKGGDLRYCQKCSHYKPPRAHHCRVCKRCILRMDHHCIWINNCVGHENYKIFLVFVLYVATASLYSMVLIIGGAVHSASKDEQAGSDSPRSSIIICGVILSPIALSMTILLGWHVYLILHNKTTIEYHEGVRALWLAEKAGNLYHHPYDLGVYHNIISVPLGNRLVDTLLIGRIAFDIRAILFFLLSKIQICKVESSENCSEVFVKPTFLFRVPTSAYHQQEQGYVKVQ